MLNDIVYRLRGLFHRQKVEDELQEELAYHLEREADKNQTIDPSAKDAQRQARLSFSGLEQVRQQCREARGTRLIDDFFQDLRYGLRSIRKNPGFTIVIVLTLALGVGSCTAIFSIVNAVLIRSLPYGNAEELVYLLTPNPNIANVPVDAFGPSYADFFDLQRESVSFANMSAFEPTTFSSTSGDVTVRVGGARVDRNFFSTLQSFPETGRTIQPDEDEPGRNRVVVISHTLWESMYGESVDILSKSLRLDGEVYRIIGVMPKAFGYPHETDFSPGASGGGAKTDVWIPLALSPQQKAVRNDNFGSAVARLKPGVPVQEAQTEMSTIMARLDRLHDADLRGWEALVRPFRDSAVGPVRKLMWMLFGAVSLVLLIACGNAANLMLARAAARTHEFGVRATLGAAKGRMVRQMLTESLLLGFSGGLVGSGLAYLFLRALLFLNPGNIPRFSDASLDYRVLLFAFFLAIATSLIFGLLPALFAARLNLVAFLNGAGSRGSVTGGNRLGSFLIIGELALVVTLLAGAGLLLHSYVNIETVQTGFSPSALTMGVELNANYRTLEKDRSFFRTLLQNVQSTPGIESAAFINSLPMSHSESLSTFWVDGYANQKEQMVNGRQITPAYFSVMGISLVEGRSFNEGDITGRLSVVIINEAFAHKYFAGRDPVGLEIRPSATSKTASRVVGVVRNVRHSSLEADPPAELYNPFWQAGGFGSHNSIVVRSALSPATTATVVRDALRKIDPDLAMDNLHTMGDLVSEASAQRRFQTSLLAGFAAMAMILGMVGIYGLLAYSVKQRTAEIGVRIALGASRGHVLGMVLRHGLKLSIAGLGLGLVISVLLTGLLSSSLYGVKAFDPMTYAAVPALLLLATIAACLVPARRAASVDPIHALRRE